MQVEANMRTIGFRRMVMSLYYNIQRKRESYTIMQMVDDEDIIKAFHESSNNHEFHSTAQSSYPTPLPPNSSTNETPIDFGSVSAENEPSAFNTPNSNKQGNVRSFIQNEPEAVGLSQLQTPQFSTTKVKGKKKQDKQD